MQAIDLKLFRDFGRLWAQGLAIAMVLAAGVAVILMSVGMGRALNDSREAYYAQNRFGHVFAEARRAPDRLTRDIARIPGVMTVETTVRGYATLDLPGRSKPATGLLISRDLNSGPNLNIPILRSGRWPERTGQVVVNEPFAKANGFLPGDRFEANMNGRKQELIISGTALSPEFIYTIGPGALMPQNETFGVLWMPEDVLDATLGMEGAFTDISLAVLPGTPLEPVMDELESLLEPYGGISAVDRSDQLSNAFLDAQINELEVLSYVLPPVFLGITIFLVNMVMGRIVFLERAEIGLMKAIGYSDWEVCLHYLMLAGLIAVIGIGIGFGAGTWLAQSMAQLYAKFFDFPSVVFNVPSNTYALAAILALGATSLGALRSALKAARLAPAVAMAPPAPPNFRRSVFDQAADWLNLSQPMRMILRSLTRWPVRAATTVLGVSLAVSILVASTFFPDSLDVIIDRAFYQSNRQDMILFFDPDVPLEGVENVRRLPGVLQVEAQQHHSVVLRHGPYEKQTSVSTISPENDLVRIVDADGMAVMPDATGLMLSERLAESLSVRKGDMLTVTFETGLRETFEVPVSGIVTQYLGLGAYMDYDRLNHLFRQSPRMTTANVTLFDPLDTSAFDEEAKDVPQITGVIDMTANRQSFLDTISQNVLIMTTAYTILGTIITVGVCYNAARIQLSERARELASLRILGFTKLEVSQVLSGEILLLVIIAQPLGWWLGTEIARLMTEGFSSDLYSMPLVMRPSTYALSSLIVLAAAAVSTLIVTRRLAGLDLISVMKTRE